MILRSKLFAGDARLEAAAALDSEAIKFGDRGDHVRKIQLALNMIDSCGLTTDGIFDPATLNAVILFKRARDIVERSIQGSSDGVVAKRTVGALDNEVWSGRKDPPGVLLRVIAPRHPRGPSKRHAADHRTLTFATKLAVGDNNAPPQIDDSGAASQPPSAGRVITFKTGQAAVLEVLNADGGTIEYDSGCTARVVDPITRKELKKIEGDRKTFEIRPGQPQTTKIFIKVSRNLGLTSQTTTMILVVHNSDEDQILPSIEPHNHLPTGKWEEVLKDIEQPTDDAAGKFLKRLCNNKAPPTTFARDAAIFLAPFSTARHHLNWFLSEGHGADFIENDNIRAWVDADDKLRDAVANFVRKNAARGKLRKYVNWTVDLYGSGDFRNTFGGIDKLFIEFDMTAKTIKLSFKDIYEWHPVCEQHYHKFDDDIVRNTNSLHAAFVELKGSGAADFWMVGEATFPMSKFGLP